MHPSNKKVLTTAYDRAIEYHDKNNRIALHRATRDENITFVRELLDCGFNANLQDNNTWTPLHYAAMYNKTSDIAFLLIFGGRADVNSKDFMNRRPIHLSKICTLKLLLKCGAYVNARDELGNTPLVNAIRLDCPDSVDELISYGADINEISVVNLLDELEQYNRSLNLLFQHWTKLKTAELHCSTEYESFIEYNGYYYKPVNRMDWSSDDDNFITERNYCQRFYQKCLNEIEMLKKTHIDSRCKSLYTFLHARPKELRKYLKNENLQQVIKSPNFGSQFPEYSIVILAKYREAEARQALLEPAREAWYELTKVQLPDCIDQVLDHLDNADLIALKDTLTTGSECQR